MSKPITIGKALGVGVINDMIGNYTNIGDGAEELRTLLRLKGINYSTVMTPISDEYREDGEGGLYYGRTNEWLAIETEFKPKVIEICKKLAPYANLEIDAESHLGRLIKYEYDSDFFDTLLDYGFNSVDKAVMYFPLMYNMQLNVLNELVDLVKEGEIA